MQKKMRIPEKIFNQRQKKLSVLFLGVVECAHEN